MQFAGSSGRRTEHKKPKRKNLFQSLSKSFTDQSKSNDAKHVQRNPEQKKSNDAKHVQKNGDQKKSNDAKHVQKNGDQKKSNDAKNVQKNGDQAKAEDTKKTVLRKQKGKLDDLLSTKAKQIFFQISKVKKTQAKVLDQIATVKNKKMQVLVLKRMNKIAQMKKVELRKRQQQGLVEKKFDRIKPKKFEFSKNRPFLTKKQSFLAPVFRGSEYTGPLWRPTPKDEVGHGYFKAPGWIVKKQEKFPKELERLKNTSDVQIKAIAKKMAQVALDDIERREKMLALQAAQAARYDNEDEEEVLLKFEFDDEDVVDMESDLDAEKKAMEEGKGESVSAESKRLMFPNKIFYDQVDFKHLPQARLPDNVQAFITDTSTGMEMLLQKYVFNPLCTPPKFVGFDCEWIPQNGGKQIDLMQLAFDNVVILFRFSRCKINSFSDMPRSLIRVLQDPNIFKFCQDPSSEMQVAIRQSKASPGKFSINGMVDVDNIATRYQCKPRGLQALVAMFCQKRLKKLPLIQCSNWCANVLSPAQIEYAAVDAWISKEVGLRMMEEFRRDTGFKYTLDDIASEFAAIFAEAHQSHLKKSVQGITENTELSTLAKKRLLKNVKPQYRGNHKNGKGKKKKKK